MYPTPALPLVVAIAVGAAAPVSHAGERLQTAPTHDVDITYRITHPGLPMITDRRRWLANQHLRRVDEPDGSATIYDLSRGELTVLNASSHTYQTLEGAATRRMSPPEYTKLKRGGEFKIAGV